MATTKIRMLMLEDPRTQFEIAGAARIAPSRLSEYALAKKAIPAHHIYALCQTLHCNVQDLLGFVDEDVVDEFIERSGSTRHNMGFV